MADAVKQVLWTKKRWWAAVVLAVLTLANPANAFTPEGLPKHTRAAPDLRDLYPDIDHRCAGPLMQGCAVYTIYNDKAKKLSLEIDRLFAGRSTYDRRDPEFKADMQGAAALLDAFADCLDRHCLGTVGGATQGFDAYAASTRKAANYVRCLAGFGEEKFVVRSIEIHDKYLGIKRWDEKSKIKSKPLFESYNKTYNSRYYLAEGETRYGFHIFVSEKDFPECAFVEMDEAAFSLMRRILVRKKRGSF